MTTCLIIGLFVTCSGVTPRSPEEAVRTFLASATRPLVVSAPIMGVPYLPPPLQQPTQSRIPPPSPQWSSMTTYTPRFGPPEVVLTYPDGRVVSNYDGPYRGQRRYR